MSIQAEGAHRHPARRRKDSHTKSWETSEPQWANIPNASREDRLHTKDWESAGHETSWQQHRDLDLSGKWPPPKFWTKMIFNLELHIQPTYQVIKPQKLSIFHASFLRKLLQDVLHQNEGENHRRGKTWRWGGLSNKHDVAKGISRSNVIYVYTKMPRTWTVRVRLYMDFFHSKDYSTTWLMVESTDVSTDTVEPHILRADYQLHMDFQMCGGSEPLIPTPIKGQLYISSSKHWRKIYKSKKRVYTVYIERESGGCFMQNAALRDIFLGIWKLSNELTTVLKKTMYLKKWGDY